MLQDTVLSSVALHLQPWKEREREINLSTELMKYSIVYVSTSSIAVSELACACSTAFLILYNDNQKTANKRHKAELLLSINTRQCSKPIERHPILAALPLLSDAKLPRDR